MGIFKTTTPVNPIAKNEAISADAFSLFSETINKLTDADVTIQADIDEADARIQEAEMRTQAERNTKTQLEVIRKRNADLNKKISKFFGTV